MEREGGWRWRDGEQQLSAFPHGIEPHSHRRFGEVGREKKTATAQLVGCGVPKDCVVVHGGSKVVCVDKSFEYVQWRLTFE